MSAGEGRTYEQMVAVDARKSAELKRAAKEAGEHAPAAITTEPIETMFFKPTKEDIAIARKWQRRLGDRPGHDMQSLFTAIRLVAQGKAVSLSCLETLRQFDRDHVHVMTEADEADRRYVEEDNRRLAELDAAGWSEEEAR